MRSLVLQLSNPAVRRVMEDLTTQQRWEALRQSPAPLSAVELSTACGAPVAEVQRSLDLLLDAGFVERIKAHTRRRVTTYRAPDAVVVECDFGSDSDHQLYSKLRGQFRDISRAISESADQLTRDGKTPGFRSYTEFWKTVMVTEDQVAEVTKLIRALIGLLAEYEARATKSQGPKRGPRLDARRTQEVPVRPYHFSVFFGHTSGREPLLPEISTYCRTPGLPNRFAAMYERKGSTLSAREAQAASLLARGLSRPQVAAKLGVTANTVAAMTKRIYTKLGVRNRAEFVASFKGLSP